jgi:crotonobetainyl-CoA:carnitine CoA-transferase CaiB-like acyl-CoA transferase
MMPLPGRGPAPDAPAAARSAPEGAEDSAMRDVLAGVKVLEVAQFWFVPSAGAVLADWGADVVKIEHPERGDAQRGLASAGLAVEIGGVDFLVQQPNRGKRSVGLDLAKPAGREILYRLVERCDVFLTNFLPQARRRLEIDVEHVRARNPRIIYVRGSGYGDKGAEREKGGYDASAFWTRGGVAAALTPPGLPAPIGQRPAFGDGIGGLAIAGGIAAALFRRERTGEPSVLDVSLLGTAMWVLSPDVVASALIGAGGEGGLPRMGREAAPNPLVNYYRTGDGRWLILLLLQPDRYWEDLCRRLGRPELASDPRFADGRARFANRAECIRELDAVFASRPLAEWRAAFADMEGPWAPMQTPGELAHDPQALANGHIQEVDGGRRGRFPLVSNPVVFDATPPALGRAPEMGEHTDEVLLELGLDWDELLAHKAAGAVL